MLKSGCALALLVLVCSVQAQTYKIGADAGAKPQKQTVQTQAPEPQLGWGSNIQNARLARAAQLALQRGDHALAFDYAQRAVQAAPNDAQLWFLLGYAARLDGKLPQAVDAYTRGLGLNASSLDGISGLAQTYSVMGRTADAERLLNRVVAADPRRKDDALLLGDLYMRSGDYTTALDWLGRAERLEPNARAELLMAISYQHLNQLDLASRYLDMAKRRAPNNPDVERSLAGYYREIGNYPEAITALKSIRNPKPDVTAELAYTYQLDGKLAAAANLYMQAANAMPRDIGWQLSAAQAEVAVDSVGQADTFLRRAATLDPDYYRLHAIRGEIAQLEDHDSDAAREYNAALVHLPADPVEGPLYGIQLHMDLVELYQNLNDGSAAQRQLAIAQTEIGAIDEQGSDRPQFLRLRASIKMNAGQFDSALSDAKEALALRPHDPNNLQLDGDLLMKLGRVEDALIAYKQILTLDPRNRFALTSLGYASRAAGRDLDAERYFKRLAQIYPTLYVPYLALGDLYAARHEYKSAEQAYGKGYTLAPRNALIVAGAMNADIEAHDLEQAQVWMERVTSNMRQTPQILREEERYLSFKGDYQQSATVGEQAIAALPRDRDVVVYLGYDLLRLNRYDALLELTNKYDTILPKEPDIPLLAGYVHKHNGELEQAQRDFTEALQRDPEVVTAYVNLGYVLNDLHQPQEAAVNFQSALKREPKNGEAHLGLAYSDLDLHQLQGALRQAQLAEATMGDSEPVHLIEATAYGRAGMLTQAVVQYRAALKFAPNDGGLHFGLGNTFFAERRYHDAIHELQSAQQLSPHDAFVEALIARAYANLQDRPQTLAYVQIAEQDAQRMPDPPRSEDPDRHDALEIGGLSDIYVSTGEALSTLGDQKGAMERFREALAVPHSNRINVRMAIAQLMAQQGHSVDAERQIALAVMEGEAGETAPATGDQFIAAADVFRQMHEYELSEKYLERAEQAGASDVSVRVGLADNYLALGDTAKAAAELAAVRQTTDNQADYQYLLAQANVYEQEHQSTQALTAFAQAASAAGEDQSAEQSLLQAGANEGYRINPRLSMLANYSTEGIFEDTTVYVLDSKLDLPGTISTVLPRSSLQTQTTAAFHLHLGRLPSPGGFFQVRNARGAISIADVGGPSVLGTNGVVKRDTTDSTFNFGLNPTIHLGNNAVTFNGGLQETIRRDSISARQLNQNLFRLFAYMSTSSFFNVISADGYVIRETGPFTESNIHSRALLGAIDFRVGAPWGKTALVTGWGTNDLVFTPIGTEDYYTSAYIGLTHRFSGRLNIEGVAEDLRSWRTVTYLGTQYSAIAQALRPAGTFHFEITPQWSVQGSTAYSSTRGASDYDATQNEFSVSYARALHRKFNDVTGQTSLQYPIRFSAGLQEETFFNFTHGQNQQFRPYVSITIF